MVTLKQQTLFDKVLVNVRNGNPKSLGALMIESGYHKISEQPIRIIKSKGFQYLLGQIDDKIILGRVFEILLSDDKRSALTSADMLLKLKDRYPDKVIKIGALQQIQEVYE